MDVMLRIFVYFPSSLCTSSSSHIVLIAHGRRTSRECTATESDQNRRQKGHDYIGTLCEQAVRLKFRHRLAVLCIGPFLRWHGRGARVRAPVDRLMVSREGTRHTRSSRQRVRNRCLFQSSCCVHRRLHFLHVRLSCKLLTLRHCHRLLSLQDSRVYPCDLTPDAGRLFRDDLCFAAHVGATCCQGAAPR